MNKDGPIIVIEDDEDDQLILQIAFNKLPYKNEIIFFSDGEKALTFLNDSPGLLPFLILSDIDLPKLNGLELRDKIHNNEQLRLRCIPYLFFTTISSHEPVIEAYSKSIQGFFVKPGSVQEIESIVRMIVEYWRHCTAPNHLS